MGAAESKPVVAPVISEKQALQITARTRSESGRIRKYKAPATAALSTALIAEYDASFQADAKKQLASTLLCQQDLIANLVDRKAVIADQHVFNVSIKEEGTPITNQKSSGRCWLFALTNIARISIIKNYRLDGFQLSQSYLFFYDSLEKANYFLESAIDLADAPLDSRIMQFLFKSPENDGGQFDMAAAMIKKYGLVPQAIYPESFSSSATGRLDKILTSKLREYVLELREIHDASYKAALQTLGGLQPEDRLKKSHDIAIQNCRNRKIEQMQEVYDILAIALGAPPKPEEAFTWEYYDKDKKFHSLTCTPLEFYHKSANPFTVDSISLINDPRNPLDKAYTVARLGNVWDAPAVRYVNTSSEVLHSVVIKMLQNNTPVWFGVDVGQSSNSALGIMDTALYDFENVFGTKFGMTKAQRLQTGESAMTHAMVFTAVHLDQDGKPIRYRVENSWNDTVGNKGYFVMSKAWFDEYLYQIVVPRTICPSKYLKIFDDSEATELPAWDPMGSLAIRREH